MDLGLTFAIVFVWGLWMGTSADKLADKEAGRQLDQCLKTCSVCKRAPLVKTKEKYSYWACDGEYFWSDRKELTNK